LLIPTSSFRSPSGCWVELTNTCNSSSNWLWRFRSSGHYHRWHFLSLDYLCYR
jgi:hypothetical protein